jgi:excinuclease ABC subunit B
MQAAIGETERRRAKQEAYNAKHGITPQTIIKPIRRGIETEIRARRTAREAVKGAEEAYAAGELMRTLEEEMLRAAEELEFERAAELRDQARVLRGIIEQAGQDARITVSELEEALKGGPRRGGAPGSKAGKRRRKGPAR